MNSIYDGILFKIFYPETASRFSYNKSAVLPQYNYGTFCERIKVNILDFRRCAARMSNIRSPRKWTEYRVIHFRRILIQNLDVYVSLIIIFHFARTDKIANTLEIITFHVRTVNSLRRKFYAILYFTLYCKYLAKYFLRLEIRPLCTI